MLLARAGTSSTIASAPGAFTTAGTVIGTVAGNKVRGPSVQVGTPRFNYAPPAGGAPAQVQAIIRPPPAPPVKEFGPASWVKEIRTTSHNNNEVKLRDLVSDDPDDDDDKNWRNGEPDEVEVECPLDCVTGTEERVLADPNPREFAASRPPWLPAPRLRTGS